MNNKFIYYRESGKINYPAFALSTLLILGINSLLGYLYAFILFYMPIIYANFIIAIGFGLVLSIYTHFLFRISHNRSPRSKIILLITSGISANLFQWIAFIDFFIFGHMPNPGEYYQSLDIIFEPSFFFGLIGEVNRIGLWALFGAPVRGFILALIWVAEFVIIAGVAIFHFYRSKPYPYSENLGHWYSKYTLARDFETLATYNIFLKKLNDQNLYDFINGLKAGIALRHMKIHVYYEKDEDKQYISFENKQTLNGKADREMVVNCLQCNKEIAEKILADFPNKKEKNEIF